MYLIPALALVLVVAAGALWGPFFALIAAVPLFVLFLGYVGLSRRADQTTPRPSGEPASGEGAADGAVSGGKRVS